MNNHRFATILALLAAAILPAPAAAQHAVGSWEVYSNYGIDRADVVDTDKKVYFCGGGSLFHYDKETDETYSYNVGNGLSDVDVKAIYRNYHRDYIAVVYSNGNIDLVYDDGRIVNLSDIKDAQFVTDKTVNFISFDGDDMYVAAGFGLVRYDVARQAVKDSGMFNAAVSGVAVVGSHVVVSMADGLYFIDKAQRVNDFTKFTRFSDLVCTGLAAITDNIIMALRPASNAANTYQIDFDNAALASGNSFYWAVYGANPTIKRCGDWTMVISGASAVVCRPNDNGGLDYKQFNLSSSLYTTNIYFCGTSAGNDLWYVNDNGLGHLTYATDYSATTNSSDYTIDREPSLPLGTSIHGGPIRLTASEIGVYATYNARSRHPDRDDYNKLMKINLISDGFVADITPKPEDYELVNSSSNKQLRTGYDVVVDPEDPSIIYVPTWFEGVWKFQNGKQIGKYDYTNSPVPHTYNWVCTVENLAFDNNNNLWIIHQDWPNGCERVSILPAAKNQANQAEASDWITLDLPDFGSNESKDSQIVHFKHSKNKNLAIITQTFGDCNIVIYDTKGTSAISDDTHWMLNQFTDQDGKTFGPHAVLSVAEDQNGDVWLGTECGVVVVHNLAAMLANRDNTVERIKVARNDGSALADYLLDNQEVSDIAVDAANRKWLGSLNSGAYYVSSDGREILGYYNRDNSMLPSNQVQSVVCAQGGSDIYFGTTNGLAVYHSAVAPAAADFSDVYAYPNPVRPDYSGWITIRGLMDNSLVKIADAAGNVFLQTRSEGGMVMWDGCNAAGERVATGVYYVYASQNQDDASNGAVAKILVVK